MKPTLWNLAKLNETYADAVFDRDWPKVHGIAYARRLMLAALIARGAL